MLCVIRVGGNKINYLHQIRHSSVFNTCCYNMHGFDTGPLLQDLTSSSDIIALQEHMLCDNNMHKLGMCSDNVVYHDVSGMMSGCLLAFCVADLSVEWPSYGINLLIIISS